MKDKSSKVKFLEKVVSLISEIIGSPIEITAVKVMAGLEVEKTIHFMQVFIVASMQGNADSVGCVHDNSQSKFAAGSSELDLSDSVNNLQNFPLSEKMDSNLEENKENERYHQLDFKASNRIFVNELKGLSLDVCIQMCNEDVLQTQAWVGKIIQRPKCTDKLLERPPFRFLRDIILGIVFEIDFCADQFREDITEQSHSYDKESKLIFLENIISNVSLHLDGVIVEAKPAKIIAGLEPGLTRKFLQLLVVAAVSDYARKRVSSSQSIETNNIGSLVSPPNQKDKKSTLDYRSESIIKEPTNNDINTEEGGVENFVAIHEAFMEKNRLASPTNKENNDEISVSEVTLVEQETVKPIIEIKKETIDESEEISEYLSCTKDESISMHEMKDSKEPEKDVRPMTARKRPPRSRPKTAVLQNFSQDHVEESTRKIFKDGYINNDDKSPNSNVTIANSNENDKLK